MVPRTIAVTILAGVLLATGSVRTVYGQTTVAPQAVPATQATTTQDIVTQPAATTDVLTHATSTLNIVTQPTATQEIVTQPTTTPEVVTQPTATLTIVTQPTTTPDVVTQPTVTQPAEPPPAVLQQPPAPEPDPLLLGISYFRMGNYEEALDDLTKARIKDPWSAVAAYYLGATLKKMQQYSKALPHLMEAVTLQPVAKEAYPELAEVYSVLNRNDEALKALESAEREGIEPAQTAYVKGLVLVKKKKLLEAESSFERSMALDPQFTASANFQIASIYLSRGKLTEARDRFIAVAAKDAESAFGLMAKQQADALSRRLLVGRQFSALVGAEYQYDSNVILKPDSAPSAASIANQSDTALVVAARAEYAPTLQSAYSLKLQYGLYASMYQDLKNYDVLSQTFGITAGTTIARGSLSVPLSYNRTAVDGKDYLTAFGLAPLYAFTPAEGQQAQVTLRFQQKDFQATATLPDEDRDSTNTACGIAWYWFLGQQEKGSVTARYDIDREDAAGKNWSYLGNKIAANLLYPVGKGLKLSLGAEAYIQSYGNLNSSFNVQRKDTTMTVTAQALYALTRNVDAQLQYLFMKDNSNIDVYAFSKNIIGVGLYSRF